MHEFHLTYDEVKSLPVGEYMFMLMGLKNESEETQKAFKETK